MTFTAPLTSEQVGQLLTTALPLRSLTFNTLDAATCIVLQQVRIQCCLVMFAIVKGGTRTC